MKSLAAKAERLDFDTPDSLYAFLVRVAEEKVIDEYRRVYSQKRDWTASSNWATFRAMAARPVRRWPTPVPAEPGCAGERGAHATAARRAERGWKTQVIEMKQQGYSIAEIAEQTGWHSPGPRSSGSS